MQLSLFPFTPLALNVSRGNAWSAGSRWRLEVRSQPGKSDSLVKHMKKLLPVGAVALSLILISEHLASAWHNFKFGFELRPRHIRAQLENRSHHAAEGLIDALARFHWLTVSSRPNYWSDCGRRPVFLKTYSSRCFCSSCVSGP